MACFVDLTLMLLHKSRGKHTRVTGGLAAQSWAVVRNATLPEVNIFSEHRMTVTHQGQAFLEGIAQHRSNSHRSCAGSKEGSEAEGETEQSPTSKCFPRMTMTAKTPVYTSEQGKASISLR